MMCNAGVWFEALYIIRLKGIFGGILYRNYLFA